MDRLSLEFIKMFHQWMILGTAAFLGLALLYLIAYKLSVASKSSPHAKYNFKATYEVKRLKKVFLFLALAAFVALNLYGQEHWEVSGSSGVAFTVRVFIAFAGATMLYYVASLILDYYYPHWLNKSLKAIRTKPRINPKTGNVMRLLKEEEEDVHLNEGMRAEENIFSVDYDVWYDEQSGDTIIEKYEGHKVALVCNSCGFATMRVFKEEISAKDDDKAPTQIVKHYQCAYCKSLRATAFNVSYKNANDLKNNLNKKNKSDEGWK